MGPEIQKAKQDYSSQYNMPQAIGMLDCTHVRIPKPSNHGDEYINVKDSQV